MVFTKFGKLQKIMFLSKSIFRTVIQNTPLISIDFIVKNQNNQILLGKRLNRPAKDFWFVPGGRILKDEPIATAFKRLTIEELGEEFSIHQSTLIGPFDHFYEDNVFDSEFSTHYIAMGYQINPKNKLEQLPEKIQHQKYQWLDIDRLLADPLVHKHTKLYFEET